MEFFISSIKSNKWITRRIHNITISLGKCRRTVIQLLYNVLALLPEDCKDKKNLIVDILLSRDQYLSIEFIKLLKRINDMEQRLTRYIHAKDFTIRDRQICILDFLALILWLISPYVMQFNQFWKRYILAIITNQG